MRMPYLLLRREELEHLRREIAEWKQRADGLLAALMEATGGPRVELPAAELVENDPAPITGGRLGYFHSRRAKEKALRRKAAMKIALDAPQPGDSEHATRSNQEGNA
jgi:hypothetical protein